MLPVPALLPLETLPSWPAVPDPSVIEVLVITLGIPLAIALVFVVLTLAPGWRRSA